MPTYMSDDELCRQLAHFRVGIDHGYLDGIDRLAGVPLFSNATGPATKPVSLELLQELAEKIRKGQQRERRLREWLDSGPALLEYSLSCKREYMGCWSEDEPDPAVQSKTGELPRPMLPGPLPQQRARSGSLPFEISKAEVYKRASFDGGPMQTELCSFCGQTHEVKRATVMGVGVTTCPFVAPERPVFVNAANATWEVFDGGGAPDVQRNVIREEMAKVFPEQLPSPPDGRLYAALCRRIDCLETELKEAKATAHLNYKETERRDAMHRAAMNDAAQARQVAAELRKQVAELQCQVDASKSKRIPIKQWIREEFEEGAPSAVASVTGVGPRHVVKRHTAVIACQGDWE